MIFLLTDEDKGPGQLFVFVSEEKDMKSLRNGNTIFVDQRGLLDRPFKSVTISLHENDAAIRKVLDSIRTGRY